MNSIGSAIWRQMRVAPLFGPSRRMQRVAEEDQPLHAFDALRRDVRGDPPAHRLAADEERQLPELRAAASSSTSRQCASSTGALSGTLRPAVM